MPQLRTKCSDLEFEAGRFACQASQQGELESKLRVTAATAAEEEQRANDLHQKLTETEAISSTLRLSLEVDIIIIAVRRPRLA